MTTFRFTRTIIVCALAALTNQGGRAQALSKTASPAPFDAATFDSLLQQPPATFGAQLPFVVLHRVEQFMAINRGTEEFANKVPYLAQPIHAHGVEGVAYYEVWFTRDGRTPEGWVLVAATDLDYPIVNFSPHGTPYSLGVRARATSAGHRLAATDRFFRFGVSYFALESAAGQLIADFGHAPSQLLVANGAEGGGHGSGGPGLAPTDVTVQRGPAPESIEVTDYASLRRLFPSNYFTAQRAQAAADMRVKLARSGQAAPNAYIYRYIDYYYNQTMYTQISPFYRYNPFACYSGCVNNAWTNLYGWWDRNMGKDRLIPTTTTGESCPMFRNSTAREDVVDPTQMLVRSLVGTFCSGNAGATSVNAVYLGFVLASLRGYGYYYQYYWCYSGGCNSAIGSILVDSIWNNHKPALVSANAHEYVGTGIAQWDTNWDWTWVYGYPGWDLDHSRDVFIYWRDVVGSTATYVY